MEHVTISQFTNHHAVFIQTPKRATLFLETQPSYTIGYIKTMIQEKQGIPPDELKLRFADQLLEDGHTLSDYNIQDGSIIYSNIGRMDVHLYFTLLVLPPPNIGESVSP